LKALQTAMQDTGAVVLHGGDYDRWDLEVRGGICGSARMLMCTEDSGSGTQLVRVRAWPWCHWVIGFTCALAAALTVAAVVGEAVRRGAGAGIPGGVRGDAAGARLRRGDGRDPAGTARVRGRRRSGRRFRADRGTRARLMQPQQPALAIYRRLLRFVRPYSLHIAGVMTLNLLATPIALLGPLPLKIVVDSAIGGRPLPGWMRP
jgi:hypothetical protein